MAPASLGILLLDYLLGFVPRSIRSFICNLNGVFVHDIHMNLCIRRVKCKPPWYTWNTCGTLFSRGCTQLYYMIIKDLQNLVHKVHFFLENIIYTLCLSEKCTFCSILRNSLIKLQTYNIEKRTTKCTLGVPSVPQLPKP